LETWRNEDTFAASLNQRVGHPAWVFYEGPPTANGKPGIHHVWARLFKDIYPRFHTMRGRYVERRAGWDCHGLPVEVEVEKELGFSGKHQIEAFGIREFNERCRTSVQRYVDDWKSMSERMGMWLDTDHAYWTMAPTYVESVWWLFHQLWDTGLVFEGEKVVPYCGRCGTALSSHELAQPGAYQDIADDSVFVRFPLDTLEADLVVWTTTPWTLPSNVAVAIGPDISYAVVRDPAGGRNLILSEARVAEVLGEAVEVLSRISASELDGLTYRRPVETLPTEVRPRILVDAFVTDEDGSGIVHLAPAFGEIDRDVCTAAGIPGLNPVGPQATFIDERLPWNGLFVRDADAAILDDLRLRGLVVKVQRYEHSYPHCWRCSTPLIYWGKPTWFVATSSKKDVLLAANQEVNWHPPTIKDGRFGNWLEHNVDWALSRDRFWGTPIPVWRCTNGHDTCISSLAELSERSGMDCNAMDPHRPFVDDIEISCDTCGEHAKRVEPVLDAWFDSGSMPAAQAHFPFANPAATPEAFPADFICEGIDQTRGWFYSLLAINALVFGTAPYRNVMCLALVVDKDGQKMSKSKGNVLDPWS
ncbi:MAG: isoleucine--tRNA ligase, partial [Acidimicrobiia bacterium]